jgi:hypothetical protein
LTVTIAGTGTGTVECKFGAGLFGSCAGPHNEGEAVEVKATPGAHSTFAGFSAGTGSASACSTSPCSFTLETDSTLTATFTQITHTLTVTIAGTGTGTVECKFGAGLFGSCAGPHNEGEAVEVKATAGAGSSFGGFSGGTGSATACSTSPCSFTLGADSSVTATFGNFLKLTVSTSGAGSGTVSSVPQGISCGATCEAEYAQGTIVTLEAVPASGSVFVEWTGGCVGSSFCHVTMSAAKSVSAVFAKAQRSLAVAKTGSGGGSVACDGAACAGSYPDGTTVVLTATPDSSSTFGGWSGAGCSGTGSCSLTITGDTTVAAAFDKKPEPVPTSPAPPPPGPEPGATKAPQGNVPVQEGAALVKLTCTGSSSCSGTAKLYAKVPQGKNGKKKTVLIGKAPFNIPDGKSKTLKVKLSGAAKQELKKKGKLKVQLKGPGLTARTITLKLQSKGK